MTIILFLVDTSASMNQRTFLGTTILDVTKNAIETFQKIRSKNPNSKWDRLMLLTYDEPPGNIKAGWKETHLQFATQLKNLVAHGVTEIGPALKSAFDMLNMNRNQSGIDTYGQGRCPFYIEPAIIISFSDGESMITSNGVHKQLTLPMANGLVGSELTKEPFRWDQRVFGIVLKLPAVEVHEPGTETTFIPSAESSPIDSMCEVTGGRSYLVSTPKQLAQTLESLAQKASMHGVVVNFDYIESPPSTNDDNGAGNGCSSPSQNSAWKSTKRMIYVKSSAQRGHSVGHWPMPESYPSEAKNKTLPPRDAQPHIKFLAPQPALSSHLMQLLPMDVYELEASPLTQHILKSKSNYCYQTFMTYNSKSNSYPFGFLQAHPGTQKVFLHVMPYNYPVLLELVDDLRKNSMKQTARWKQDFDNFLRTLPGYYASYLRRALGRLGVHNVVPESLDSCLSFMVVSYLKQVRTKAKQDYDSLVASVGQCVPPKEFIQVTNRSAMSILARQDFNELLQYTDGDCSGIASLQKELTKYESFPISVPRSNAATRKTFNYKNPYDIARGDLLSQISKLRAMLLRPNSSGGSLLKNEYLHSVPVQRMGMYHEYLAKAPQPLRKLDIQPERMHTFGNPFKVNKNLMIDEADESMPGMAVPGGSSPKRNKREALEALPSSPARKRQRKPGPLPKHISLSNRPSTPPIPSTPSPSPSPRSNGDEAELVQLASSKETLLWSLLSVEPEDNGLIKQNGIAVTDKASEHANNSPTQFSAKVVQQNKVAKAVICSPPTGVERHNENLLKRHLLKEVKRPGRNYSELFRQLAKVEGNLEEKEWVLDRVIFDAHRFKRHQLADKLIKYRDNLADSLVTNGNSVMEDEQTPAPSTNSSITATSQTNNSKPCKPSASSKPSPAVNRLGKQHPLAALKSSASSLTAAHKDKNSHR